jgi:2-polyprenyl-3-methyl-5-hydroxy-6-metoxy-1,4-benzoquinol methylase
MKRFELSMKAATKLEEARVHAAQLSGGTSGDFIYDEILHAIDELDLRGSILDFGSGTGTLTRCLMQTGRFTTVAAADLMPQPSDLGAVHWTRADLNNPLPLPDASFDSIIAAEVIEHLENSRGIARELFRLLNPGGTAIVSTPNNESWRSLLSLLRRGHHVAFCDGSYPAHITALLRKDLERILTEAGFEVPAFRFSNYGGIPGWPAISWQRITGGILRGARFSDNVIAIARKPVQEGSNE